MIKGPDFSGFSRHTASFAFAIKALTRQQRHLLGHSVGASRFCTAAEAAGERSSVDNSYDGLPGLSRAVS
jgi:hypothetical protein